MFMFLILLAVFINFINKNKEVLKSIIQNIKSIPKKLIGINTKKRANAIRFLLLEINNYRIDMEGQNILTIKFKEKLYKLSDDDLCNIFDLHCINIDANMVLDGVPLDFIKLMRSRMGDSRILGKANEVKIIAASLATIIDIDNTRV